MNQPGLPPASARLRLRVTAAAESAIRSRHPWVFDASIREQNRPGTAGELAVIYDRRDRFLAVGLFDPDSPLRVRVLHAGKPVQIDESWWRERLRATVARRDGLFDAGTTGYRLIHGESDGWPGLVLDRYANAFVVKLYTGAWLPRWPEVAARLQECLSAWVPVAGEASLVLRLSRNIQNQARDVASLEDGQVIWGPIGEGAQTFLETGLQLEAEVRRGQKTGFYLDQRENRRRIETLASGRAVLNAFSFTGGFSIYAARGGAVSVTDVDISEHALAGSRRNFEANRPDPRVASCHHVTVQADAFHWLAENRPAAFDLVVLDPPSLARREAEREGAVRAYGHLAGAGIRQLRPGGVLFAASCSAHVTEEEFFGAVLEAARRSGRRFSHLATTGHPPDHPPGFPEARYLKGVYLQF